MPLHRTYAKAAATEFLVSPSGILNSCIRRGIESLLVQIMICRLLDAKRFHELMLTYHKDSPGE